MSQFRLEDIKSLTMSSNKYVSVIETGVLDNSIPCVDDISEIQSESCDDFLNNTKENECKNKHLKEDEEFFISQGLALRVSFDINSILNHGKTFTSKIMDVHIFVVKDRKLLASMIGLSGLSSLLFFLLPFSYNLSAILFLCAPLSMAIIGFYKKEKYKSNYGL